MSQNTQPKSISRKIIKIILGIIAAFVIWVLFLVVYPYGYYHGQVIDKETRQPIGGAAVLTVYSVSWGTLAGSVWYEVTAQETLTDKEGKFYIPRKLIVATGILVEHANTAFVIFKPGYAVFPGGKGATSTPDNGRWIREKEFTVIEVPRLKTREERLENIRSTPRHTGVGDKNQRTMLELINEERESLGLGTFSID